MNMGRKGDVAPEPPRSSGDPLSSGGDTAPATLSRFIYRSRSRLLGNVADRHAAIDDILRFSQLNNDRRELTGVLLYDGAAFVQLMEGEISQLESIWEKIACDQRHEEIEILELGAITHREYAGWSMAHLDMTGPGHEILREMATGQTRVATRGRFATALALGIKTKLVGHPLPERPIFKPGGRPH